MRKISTFLDLTSVMTLALGGILMTLMMLHITLDVLGKYLFGYPLPGTFEIASGYYMVALVFLPLLAVVRGSGHISVEAFTALMPARVAAGIELFSALLVTAFTGIFAWATFGEAIHRSIEGEVWQSGTSMIVIWPSRWFLPVGLALMALATAVTLLRPLRAFRLGRPDGGGAQ